MSCHNNRHRTSERTGKLSAIGVAGTEFLPVEADKQSIYHHLINIKIIVVGGNKYYHIKSICAHKPLLSKITINKNNYNIPYSL